METYRKIIAKSLLGDCPPPPHPRAEPIDNHKIQVFALGFSSRAMQIALVDHFFKVP